MTNIAVLDEIFSINSEESLKDKILFENLAAEVNHLIQTDFEKLVNMLYRIDVSEIKLKEMLKSHPDQDAGHIIAGLLVERQIQKNRLKKEFSRSTPPSDDAEKW
jgi:hypothetical protein